MDICRRTRLRGVLGVAVLGGHQGHRLAITSLQATATRIVSGSRDTTVMVWSVP